ncbi:MAG: amidophosphoribosyltransferase [Myxococcales bacterium]|nr:amidophosphoribosyltransferase [Myxococcales bacterium]
MDDKFRHECGIFGVFGEQDAGRWTCVGLGALQHRGQESAGIAAVAGSQINLVRQMGLVADIFDEPALDRLSGDRAIGHVRYSTSGLSEPNSAQPFVIDHPGARLAIAHNGNLIDALSLRRSLKQQGILFQSTSDSEIILHLLAHTPGKTLTDRAITGLSQLRGAYSLLAVDQNSMIAVRDPWGFRPLVIGKKQDAWVFSSETCALSELGAAFIREVQPGEVVTVDATGQSSRTLGDPVRHHQCVFELVYFARPDSIVFGESVVAARKAMGAALARTKPVPQADIVIPVPDSGVFAAIGYAHETRIPYEMGLMRSHHVRRTFIEPTSSNRTHGVHQKLTVNQEVVSNRRVIVVDDSLVRGNTAKYMIGLLRRAGAKTVHVRIASPPVQWPCYFGIDTPDRNELLAAIQSVNNIGDFLGADSLEYLDADALHRSIQMGATRRKYCDACFTGAYPSDVNPNGPRRTSQVG